MFSRPSHLLMISLPSLRLMFSRPSFRLPNQKSALPVLSPWNFRQLLNQPQRSKRRPKHLQRRRARASGSRSHQDLLKLVWNRSRLLLLHTLPGPFEPWCLSGHRPRWSRLQRSRHPRQGLKLRHLWSGFEWVCREISNLQSRCTRASSPQANRKETETIIFNDNLFTLINFMPINTYRLKVNLLSKDKNIFWMSDKF